MRPCGVQEQLESVRLLQQMHACVHTGATWCIACRQTHSGPAGYKISLSQLGFYNNCTHVCTPGDLHTLLVCAFMMASKHDAALEFTSWGLVKELCSCLQVQPSTGVRSDGAKYDGETTAASRTRGRTACLILECCTGLTQCDLLVASVDR